MNKKYFSLLIAVMVLICSSITSFAETESINNNTTEVSELAPMISDLLEMVKSDKDGSGLSDIDFENLSIGDKIPVYRTESSDLQEINADYYPIMEENKIVAIATVTYNNGQPMIQLGKRFADELQNFTEDKDQVALVFNDNNQNLYACDENGYSLIDTFASNLNETEEKNMAEDFVELKSKNIEFNKIKPVEELNIDQDSNSTVSSSFLDSRLLASSTEDFAFLSVPIKLQGNYRICWACSVASIGQYVTGKDYTGKKVCHLVNHAYTDGSQADAKAALEDIYNLEIGASRGAPKFDKIISEIDSDEPIWAGFTSNNGNHAVVFRGYSYGTKSSGPYKAISYMDPNESSYQYLYFTTDKVYQLAYGNATLTCDCYLRVN